MHTRQDPIAYAYSGQDGNGSLSYFVGKRHGTGCLRSLTRLAFPILKKAVGFAGNVASTTLEDLLENRKSFKESLRDNALNETQRVFTGGKRPSSSAINTTLNKHIRKQHSIFAKK